MLYSVLKAELFQDAKILTADSKKKCILLICHLGRTWMKRSFKNKQPVKLCHFYRPFHRLFAQDINQKKPQRLSNQSLMLGINQNNLKKWTAFSLVVCTGHESGSWWPSASSLQLTWLTADVGLEFQLEDLTTNPSALSQQRHCHHLKHHHIPFRLVNSFLPSKALKSKQLM